MPSINMIAPRRGEKRRLERDMRRLVIVIVVELVFAIGLGGWVATKIFTTRSQIADLEIRIMNFQPTVRQIERYEAATAKLTPKLELLNQARSDTMGWYDILDRLAGSMPTATWLTRISTSPSTEGELTTLTLSGVSGSQERVGETMMRLATNPEFGSVDLHFTQRTMLGTTTAFEFEIGTTIKAAAQAKGVMGNGPDQS